MHRNFTARTGAAAFALALATGASAQSLEVSYSVRLVGLSLGTAGLSATVDASAYNVEVNAKLSGVAATVSRSEGAAQASGGFVQGKILPNAYATTSSNSTQTRTVRMAMNAGTVRAVEITPPFDIPPDRIPVTEAHKRSILDPLSALVMPAAYQGPVLSPAACNRTLPVFDGYTRFDIQLSFAGMRAVKARGYSGEVAVCSARYKPVSGHRPNRQSTKFMADNKNIEVWLMPIEGARALAPYRISVATMVGSVVIEAANVSLAQAGDTRRAAR